MRTPGDMPRSRFNPRAIHLAFIVAATLASGCNAVFGINEGTPPPPCYDPTNLLIDDMDDGVGDICNLAGRQGSWYTVGDGTSTTLDPAPSTPFTPSMIVGARGRSHYAARFTGSGFTDWGAAMGFSLDGGPVSQKTYDASSTGGITFWMKSNVPVSVEFLIPETVSLTNGGDCVASANNPNCDNAFSFQITAPTSEWVQYYVPFSALTQQFGGSATWNPQLLLGAQFFVGPGAAFDVWVDDVSFYYCTTSGCVPTCVDPAFPVSCPARGSYPAACRPAGTNCSAVVTWCSDPLLIDDMEDGNNVICNSGGRQGYWYTGADGTEGTLSPSPGAVFAMAAIPGARGDSRVAARMTGSGFTGWGALMGFDLDDQGQPYDASATGGIAFWLKSNSPVWVSLPIPATEPVGQKSGTCVDGTTAWNCANNFGFEISAPNPDEWVEHQIPYAALQQGGEADANGNTLWGSASWDSSQLLSVLFASNGAFDVWVDDVQFYPCAGASCVPTCADPLAPVACPASGAAQAGCWSEGTDCSNPPDFILTCPWGSASGDVWAVGTYQGPSAVILHWDGVGWSSFATDGAGPLWGVWGSAADDVWAVGDFGTVDHWNGSGWTSAATDTKASLQAVWGSAADDIWAVGGNGAILHYDGSWSVSQSVSSKALYRLWGNAQDDVWAVGDGGTILHYNGSSWSASASGTDSILWGVWGSDRNNVYAVGNTASGDATILQWNGTSWSPVSTPAAPYPNAIWGSGPDDVWVVGQSILHFDGKIWSALPSSTSEYLYAVWGTGQNDAWIVGAAGTILHWGDNQTWSAVSSTTGALP